MAKAPKREYTDAEMHDYAGYKLERIDARRPGEHIPLDLPMERAILQRLRALIEAERIRKGRPALPAQRPRSDLGEMVEARKSQGLNTTEAREAVAKEKRVNVKTVAQAHRRWLARNKPLVRRRKRA